jgi:hypothetical protein
VVVCSRFTDHKPRPAPTKKERSRQGPEKARGGFVILGDRLYNYRMTDALPHKQTRTLEQIDLREPLKTMKLKDFAALLDDKLLVR